MCIYFVLKDIYLKKKIYKKCVLIIYVSFFYRSESNGMSENIIIALLATNLITIVPLVGLLIHLRRNIKKLLNCNSSSKNSTQLSNARKEKDNNTENIFQNGIGSETENVRLYPILN